MVADLQRGDHRRARDLERLDHECAQEKRYGDRDADRLGVFAQLALAPAREVNVDLLLGFAQRNIEFFDVERLFLHRVAQPVERAAQVVALLGGQRAFDVARASLEDPIRLVEQSARIFEPAAHPTGQIGPTSDSGQSGPREGVSLAPEEHLQQCESDDAHRHRLFSAERPEATEDPMTTRIRIG